MMLIRTVALFMKRGENLFQASSFGQFNGVAILGETEDRVNYERIVKKEKKTGP